MYLIQNDKPCGQILISHAMQMATEFVCLVNNIVFIRISTGYALAPYANANLNFSKHDLSGKFSTAEIPIPNTRNSSHHNCTSNTIRERVGTNLFREFHKMNLEVTMLVILSVWF